MRLVYFGSGQFGAPTLKRLAGKHDVTLVVTQPDRPAGRRRKLAATPISRLADDQGLDTFKTADVNDPESRQRIQAAQPDALVVIAFGQKLTKYTRSQASRREKEAKKA